MMDSLFLAKVIGLYLVISSVIMLIRSEHFRFLIRETIENSAVFFLAAIITLILGILLVVGHEVWTGWPVIVTVIGWLTLIAGCIRLAYPEGVRTMSRKLLQGTGYWVISIVCLVFGVLLCYWGFYS